MKVFVLMAAAALLPSCNNSDDQRTVNSQFSYRSTGSIGVSRTRADTGIITDKETGCQYVITAWRDVSLTPRLGKDGKPICGGPQ
jgi:hypothetical protein